MKIELGFFESERLTTVAIVWFKLIAVIGSCVLFDIVNHLQTINRRLSAQREKRLISDLKTQSRPK